MSTSEPIFVVQLNVEPDQEQAWNDWYNQTHVPEVMAASDGIVSATRYRLGDGNIPFRYLAIYRFQTADALETFMRSPRLAEMSAAYTRDWGAVSSRVRGAFLPLLHREQSHAR